MRDEARQEAYLPLEEIVVRDPASALYLPLAERLLERGRTEEAIRLCEERRTRPGSGVGDRIVLGRAYLADGRLGDAHAEFQAALELDRENVVALKALAGILSHRGRHEDAAGFYRAVCRVDPGDLESQTALHQITSGEYPEARPPDVIVGQGELAWHPVGLPREEEHLPELGLGLRTIESFDVAQPTSPHPSRPPAGPSRPAVAPVPTASTPMPTSLVPAGPAPVPAPVEPAPLATSSESSERAEASGPVPLKPGPIVEGNKSAFEDWLRQLGGSKH